MSGLRRLLLRLYHVVRPGAGEAELDRELRSHLTLLEDEYVRRGRTPEAARRAIGNMALVKDHQRDARSIRWVDDLLRDMRYKARRQRAAPAHTIVTVLTLALGIGASTAVFAVVNGLFLKSLPVRGADRLVHVYAQRPGGAYAAGFSLAEYASLRGHVRGLSALAAETEVAQLHVVVDAGSVEARGAFVTADYFSLMRVEAARGRTFSQDEDLVPGRSPVVLISDHLWRELFGADPQAVGREIRVNGVRMSVIGVTSPSFNGDDPGRGADVWIPAAMLDATGFGCDPGQPCPLFDFLVGRLADGVATARVEAEAAAVIAWQAALDPNQGRRRRLLVETATGTDPETRDALRPQMLLLVAVTGTLLLVICANLAGLSLARDSARKREFAVRMSLGATHGRLARQVHAESLVQGVFGGVAGLLVSRLGLDLLARFYRTDAEGFLHAYDFTFDGHVFVYAAGLSALTSVLVGVLPAIEAARSMAVNLQTGARAVGPNREPRLRQVLVAAQIALALVLVVSSSLLSESHDALQRGTNFDPSQLVVFRLRPELDRAIYAGTEEALIRNVAGRLRSTPGVNSVAMMIGGEGLMWQWASGRTATVGTFDARDTTTVRTQDVDGPFFETLGIPILAGRAFTDRDDRTAPLVAIVNETLARQMWPTGPAVGQVLTVHERQYRVVGVVGNIQPPNAVTADSAHLYLPFWQTAPAAKGDVRLAVRVAASPAAALPLLRDVVQGLDPNIPFGEDMPMLVQLQLTYGPVLLAQRVLTFCGLLALGLSGMGLYTVLAIAVRSRTREIGLRMALGADPRSIVGEFLFAGLTVTMVGIAAGLAVAWLATRLLSAWLYGVTSHDLAAFSGGALTLLTVAALAGYFPSRRAAHVDPLIALRQD